MSAALALAFVAALAAVAWARPLPLLDALCRALAFVVADVLRVRRREVEARLAACSFERPERTARAMYASLARGLAELAWSTGPLARSLDQTVHLTARAEQALALASRGAVIATAHTGNWDLVGVAIARTRPLHVVSKRLRVRALDALWQRARAGQGLSIIDVRGALAHVLRALSLGHLVVMVIDQAPERARGVVRFPFLGLDAWHDRAPATAAARAGVPLVLALARRLDDGTHEIDAPVVLVPPERPGERWLDEATRCLSAGLEAFVRAHPEQWLWLHRRWKPLPQTSPRGGAAQPPSRPAVADD